MRMHVGVTNALCASIALALATPASGAGLRPTRRVESQVRSPQTQASQSDKTTVKTTSPTSQAAINTLGTVVVTATRRKQKLQSVPSPVSVLTFHDLKRQHLKGFADYAAAIPGLTASSSGPGLTQLTIRGVSTGSQDLNATVGIYVDNTPFGSSAVVGGGGVRVAALETPNIDPADLERIEVLKGPQGTLYGAGALGGVIRFITIPPDTESYSGRLQVGGAKVSGGGAGFSTRGMVNLPLVSDKLAVRANVYNRLDPGFIDDAYLGKTDVNKSRTRGGRISLLWTPNDKTSLRVTVQAQNLNGYGMQYESLDPTTLKPVYGDLQQRSAAGTGTMDARFRTYNATFKTDLGWATLMSSTSYNSLDSVFNVNETDLLFPGYQANGHPISLVGANAVHETQATEEIRLTSPKSQRVEWLSGVFFSHQIANPDQYFYTADYNTGARVPSPIGDPGFGLNPGSYIAYAVYADATWHITDRFSLEGGLRYSHNRQHYKEIGDGILFGTTAPTLIVDQGSSDSTVTYALTPAFHVNKNLMVYARVATGFLPGGPNNLTALNPGIPRTFGPTTLTDYELGLKSTSLNNQLSLDLSAYYIDWKDIQLSTFVNPDSFLVNGGKAEIKGADATIAYLAAPGLKLSINASYNHAILATDAPPPSNGRRGDTLPYAPHFTLGFNGDYDFTLGAGWHGYVGASYQYLGKRRADFTADPNAIRPSVPAYHTINLRAGVNHGQWNIGLYVKNLSNERGIVNVDFESGTAALLNPVTGKMEDEAFIIPPRTFGISVSRTF